MSNTLKISQHHLDKKALVYIRQSSQHQVQNHLESQRRQYELQHRANALGWTNDRCLIIDEDLGISGARSENRPGYQKLISMIALKEVGIVFSIEVSRLARNCLDWYELLEVASTFQVLIGDEDAIYDPSDFNDRLLLGLRGTISEVELQQIKVRMSRGRMNKARRGELEYRVPIGYERDHNGKVRKTADKSVEETINEVFRLFKHIQSVRGVLKEMNRRQMEMPHFSDAPGFGRQIHWRAPVYDAIYNILKNEFYAGTYIYGKKKSSYNPVTKKQTIQTVDSKDWDVYIPNHHPAYVSLNDYHDNVKTISENGHAKKMSRGAPREGSALLQGIVFCAKCGRKMRPRYSEKKCYYCCDADHRRRGEPVCGWASARRIDDRVQSLMLDVLNEGTIDLSFQVMKKYKEEHTVEQKLSEKTLARLEYEANLARRRYESVDPENRLVASTLETEWNEKLSALHSARESHERKFSRPIGPELSVKKVKSELENIHHLWKSNHLEMTGRKQIIRTIIDRVTLKTSGKVINVEVIWQGGVVTRVDVPKYLFSDFRILERITDLAAEKTDKEIAETLNREGMKTHKGKPWTTRRVMDFRLSNAIASSFTLSEDYRLADGGFISTGELGRILGVKVTTIQKWYHMGVLRGQHAGGQSSIWIRSEPDLVARLNGTAKIGPSANSISKLAKTLNKSIKETVLWASQEGLEIVRVRRGSQYRFYVQPTQQ